MRKEPNNDYINLDPGRATKAEQTQENMEKDGRERKRKS